MVENSYSAPRADLRKQQNDDEVTPEMIAAIASAGKWARLISIVAFLGVIAAAIGVIAGVIMGFTASGVAFIGAVFAAIILWVVWLIFSAMNNYAKIAKNIEDSDYPGDDIAECFAYSTRFLKIQILFVISIVLTAIFAAIVIPAFSGRM